MSARRWVNPALLALVAALGWLALRQPEPAPGPAPVTVSALPAAQVSALRVERPGREPLALAREGGRWRLLSPLRASASEEKVAALLRVLSAESQSRLAVESVQLAALGLAPPQATLHAGELEIHFGHTQPLTGERYLRVGDTVHLTTDLHYYHLIAEPASWVSPALLADLPEPARLRLPQGQYTREGAAWHGGADPAEAARLAEAWRTARAERVTTRVERPERTRVAVEDGQGRVLEFAVMDTEGGVALGRADLGVEYHLGAAAAERLLGPPPGEAGAP